MRSSNDHQGLTTENYYALIIAIFLKVPPEIAFEVLNTGKLPRAVKFADEDIEDMIALKQIMTYRQVGQVFGVSQDVVRNKIRRHRGVI